MQKGFNAMLQMLTKQCNCLDSQERPSKTFMTIRPEALIVLLMTEHQAQAPH